MCANTDRPPSGVICTIVVPVPWKFDEALKLLTSTSPATRRPRFSFTTAMPYGLTSPLCGTVDPSVVTWVRPAMNGPDAETATEPSAMPVAGMTTIASRPRR